MAGEYFQKKVTDDRYIRVDIPDPGWAPRGESSAEEWLREARSLMEEIKRHVDSAGVAYEIVERYLCIFCGLEVEPDVNGMPQCCEEQIAYWREPTEPPPAPADDG